MITENKVVSMMYVLQDENGNVLDTSEGKSFDFLQGHHNIIMGLEKALNGLNVGDRKHVEITPDEGYGPYDPQLKFAMNRAQFGGDSPEPGMMVELSSSAGEAFAAAVVGVEGEEVYLDANHPLAGKSLFFDVEITAIRDASEEELSHGHPHGAHSHHH